MEMILIHTYEISDDDSKQNLLEKRAIITTDVSCLAL